MLVDEEGVVWFRQSWLDTANRCNERGRLALVLPEWNEATNDLALIGTASHWAIQTCLTDDLNLNAIQRLAYDRAIEMCGEVEVRWTKHDQPEHLATHARRCVTAWYHEIRPRVEPGGKCEQEFSILLGEHGGHRFGITGTVDYVTPTRVWDWKTSARKFQQREKQRTAIQPTVYAVAATRGAFGFPFEWPVTFTYGVMVRGNDVATSQIIDVRRSHAHEGWLLDVIKSYIDLADGLGVQRHWPRDEDHYLCNETWCPWWSVCKGARLSSTQDLWST